jgi:hypothetical protein
VAVGAGQLEILMAETMRLRQLAMADDGRIWRRIVACWVRADARFDGRLRLIEKRWKSWGMEETRTPTKLRPCLGLQFERLSAPVGMADNWAAGGELWSRWWDALRR